MSGRSEGMTRGAGWWSRRGFWPVLAGAALVVAACGGGVATATPSNVFLEEVLAESAQAMAQVTSLRYSLVNEGGETPLPAGLGMRSARGTMVQPDRMTAEVKATVAGFFVEIQVINVGGQTFMTNPLTGDWQVFDEALAPLALFDPAVGVQSILKELSDASLDGQETVQGVPSHRIVGRLTAEALRFIAGSYAEGSVLRAELFIGAEDLMLREVRLEGRLVEGEPEGITHILTFSDFNEPFVIEPPI